MFLATLTVVAQLNLSQPTGIQLDNRVAQVTEPADIQPAYGVLLFQTTIQGGELQSSDVLDTYQPTVRTGVLQQTVMPQEASY